MPRGVYNRKSTPAPEMKVTALTQKEFSDFPWWTKLSGDEQKAVVHEGEALSQALLHYGQARLSVGEHLTKLQGILEPHNLFQRFLKHYHFNKRTAYRYIAGFKNVQQRLPQAIVKAAVTRNFDLIGSSDVQPFGRFTAAVDKLPPPSNPTEVQANTWLDQLEQVQRDTRNESMTEAFSAPVADSGTMLKECYRFVNLRYRRLPNNSKARANWVRSLVGMLLADLGATGQQTFVATAIPEDFRAVRGRPAVGATA